MYPELRLDPPVAAALEALVEGYAGALVEVLADAGLDEPICALCLSPGQEEGMDTLALVYAQREVDRDRVAAEVGGWWEVWVPFSYRDEEDVIHPSLVDSGEDEYVDKYVSLDPQLVAAWAIVRDAIEDRVLSAEYWVHGQIAHHLNRRALPIPATANFVAWVFDFDAGPAELIEMFDAVLLPKTRAALAEAGLIGEDPEGFESLDNP